MHVTVQLQLNYRNARRGREANVLASQRERERLQCRSVGEETSKLSRYEPRAKTNEMQGRNCRLQLLSVMQRKDPQLRAKETRTVVRLALVFARLLLNVALLASDHCN